MRTLTDWLEDTLAAEPKPKVTEGAKVTQHWAFNCLYGIGLGFTASWLQRWNWRPVDVFLTLAALSIVVNFAIYRTFPPPRVWAILALVLIGGVLVTVYLM